MKPQKTPNNQMNPSKIKIIRRDSLPDLKIQYRAIVLERNQADTHVVQWIKIEDTNMGTCNDSNLIFDKDAKNIHWKNTASSTNGARKQMFTRRRQKLEPYFHLAQKQTPNGSKTQI